MRRREFLQLPAIAALPTSGQRKKIAALTTTYFLRSHADDIITRFLEGYWINDQFYAPPCDIVSLYMDQVHPADIGYRLAAAYNFPVVKSIAEALTLGRASWRWMASCLWPSTAIIRSTISSSNSILDSSSSSKSSTPSATPGGAVPVYCDKHLSWSWDEAKQMYDWSRELQFPMMAGSSVSVTFRRPELDYPLGVEFDDALAVGNGWVTDGGLFHDLEVLQCFVERRKGGETGVRSVQHIQGDEVWRAAEQGRWSRDLHACRAYHARRGPAPGVPRK